MCHRDDITITHAMPCCDLTYEKYIDKDGVVDIDRWSRLFVKNVGHEPTITNKDGTYYWITK